MRKSELHKLHYTRVWLSVIEVIRIYVRERESSFTTARQRSMRLSLRIRQCTVQRRCNIDVEKRPIQSLYDCDLT
jgi:hypothetical protein